MPKVVLADHYDRYDKDKEYDRVLFRATRTAQSAELNELQRIFNGKLAGIADALFKNGDIIRDAQIVYDSGSGQALCQAGLIYLEGAVRAVPETTLTLPTEGTVAIGVFMSSQVITELEDPGLYNPAIGSRGEGDPGAARLRLSLRWGLSTETEGGNFYPVHTVEEGEILAKEPPPNLDSLTQALARYDRDSAGGTYVVSGLTVLPAPDLEDGRQVYTVAEGRARVFGYAIELGTSRRLTYDPEPDYLTIESEPHQAAGEEGERIELDRYPVGQVSRIRVTREATDTVTHGSYLGCHDPLPNSPVAKILEVKQGGQIYSAGDDYKLTAGKVDWSLSGQEPAPYSTYTVTYQYISTEEVDASDPAGFNISGAVEGSHIYVDYTQILPRYDRLCLTKDGAFIWVRGVAAQWNPLPPVVGDDLLAIATIKQTWDEERRVKNDGVRVVPMDEISSINTRLDELTEHMAQQRLTSDIFTREAGAKKGFFVDPFLSDEMRDQGLAQTGAIVDGVLTLPVGLNNISGMTFDVRPSKGLDFTTAVILEQLARTGEMRVNPYNAFDPLPAAITLTPAVDRWTEVESIWASPVTQTFWGGFNYSSSETETLGSKKSALEYLREIDVVFKVEGFGPGESLAMTFDGLEVTPTQTVADASGVVAGSFRIPPKVPAGSKPVTVSGSGGSRGETIFVGQGELTVQTLRRVTTVVLRNSDPLAQTFILNEVCQLAAIDLWFTAKHTSRVIVQIRETTVGMPNLNILAEAVMSPEDIQTGRFTRVNFPSPATLAADTEYAFVILCDDDVTSLGLAEVGKWDLTSERWVTAQPYQIGVLLSSSNASTWTAHQDRDLTFRLHKAVYENTRAELDLGTITVSDTTDLLLLAVNEQPSAQSRTSYTLTLPDNSVITVADRQPVRLEAPISGDISVKAVLTGTRSLSPIIWPGAQLVCGKVAEEADYISRAVPAGYGSKVRVILDAKLPSGSLVTAQMQADGQSSWGELGFDSSRNLDNGWQELVFEALTDEELVRVKLNLRGSSLSRPMVDNLRVLTI